MRRGGFSSTVFHGISAVARPIAALLWIAALVTALWMGWLVLNVLVG